MTERLERGSLSSKRLALTEIVRSLRDEERLSYNAIAAKLGISRSYANQLYNDPDGSFKAVAAESA